MNKLLFFILLSIEQVAVCQPQDSSLGKPIFWYTVTNPRSMFVGAEGPSFILYNSGKILLYKKGNYWLTQLNQQENDELINELHLNDTLFNKDRFINTIDLNNEIVCCDHFIYSFSAVQDTTASIAVLGSLKHSRFRSKLPSPLLAANEVINNLTVDDGTIWLPQKIEVLLSDYAHSSDKSIKWPSNWPDLNSSQEIAQRGHVRTIYLDSKYYNQLSKLLKKRKATQAFEINGKKYFVGYRFPIPGLW